jgi:hypothetical protein
MTLNDRLTYEEMGVIAEYFFRKGETEEFKVIQDRVLRILEIDDDKERHEQIMRLEERRDV